MICIGNCMNASSFRDLWARVMFWSSQNCTIQRRVQFENLKTSRATINQEMHEQVHAIFCLLYSQQSYSGKKYLQHFIELFVFVLFRFLVDFPFWRPILPNFQPGLCCFQNILVLDFFFNSKTAVSHFVFVFESSACGGFLSNLRIAL